MRATLGQGFTDVRVLMTHPMETGLRKDAEGKLVPTHFIQNLTVKVNGKTVVDAFRVLEEQVPAGQDDDLHAWPVPLARLCDLKAVEPWHGEIGQHDVEGAPAKGLTAKPRPWSASRTSSRKSRASSANNTRSLGLGSVTKPPRGMTWTEHQRGDRLPPGVSEGGSPCYPSPEETVHDDEPR